MRFSLVNFPPSLSLAPLLSRQSSPTSAGGVVVVVVVVELEVEVLEVDAFDVEVVLMDGTSSKAPMSQRPPAGCGRSVPS